jgi:hypothetical protein
MLANRTFYFLLINLLLSYPSWSRYVPSEQSGLMIPSNYHKPLAVVKNTYIARLPAQATRTQVISGIYMPQGSNARGIEDESIKHTVIAISNLLNGLISSGGFDCMTIRVLCE